MSYFHTILSFTAARLRIQALFLFLLAGIGLAGILPCTHQQVWAAKKTQGRTLHQYRDKDGNVTLTNRPEKYRYNNDFVEIKIKYTPISVPKQYQAPASKPIQYTSKNIHDLVTRYARLYGVHESLIYAVIKAESNFDPKAVSRAGARGLMQLMPGTAAEMGVTQIFDPAQNIAGGTQYLMKMLALFNGDKKLALAAYNAGPENVKKHKGVPPFKETQRYVKKVLEYEKSIIQYGLPNTWGKLSNHPIRHITAQASTPNQKEYIVHFHSGLTQPADKVTDKDPYYYIHYEHRTYPVRKDLVKKIEKRT